jgi:GT2 family glycosyltransferase
MLLSIILLNYKKPQLTLDCIASLYEQFAKEFSNGVMELILVDNGSRDDSVTQFQEAIRKNHYTRCTVLAQVENGGFGTGNNIGARKAKGDLLLFLNNDTIVQDRGILSMGYYLQKHTDIAILGGQLSNPDGTPQPSIGKFYTPFVVSLLLLGMQKYGLLDKSPRKITPVDWVKGGLFMIRKDLFSQLNGFDENIFMYLEDMELCFRANQSGLTTAFYPDVQVVHKEHGSSNRTFAIVHIYKNLLYFYQKHCSKSEYLLIKLLLSLKAWMLIGIGSIIGNTYLVKTYKEALKF